MTQLRIIRFIKALIKHISNGFKKTPNHVRYKRLIICDICPHITKFNTCGVCGCHIHWKVKWESEKCPINKW